jgi:medium-chain acyl-[acyl-carrier-protein] hydrolase
MTVTGEAPRWFITRPRAAQAAVRLFCFPYAGGGTPIYRNWPQLLPAEVEVCMAQLPGRGSRIKETPFYKVGPMVEAIADAAEPYLDRPFAFFGHSMGAIISFELARTLRMRGWAMPSHLFVSGRAAPQLPLDRAKTYDLPDPVFHEKLRRLNGTPAEVLEHPELMELMMPLLRADFSVVETYEYTPGEPLACPITAFGGVQDAEVSRAQVEAWREQTADAFSARIMPGDHFFLNDPQTQASMLRVIALELNRPK